MPPVPHEWLSKPQSWGWNTGTCGTLPVSTNVHLSIHPSIHLSCWCRESTTHNCRELGCCSAWFGDIKASTFKAKSKQSSTSNHKILKTQSVEPRRQHPLNLTSPIRIPKKIKQWPWAILKSSSKWLIDVTFQWHGGFPSLHQKMFMFDGIVQSLLKALIITSSENWQNLPPSPTSPTDMTAKNVTSLDNPPFRCPLTNRHFSSGISHSALIIMAAMSHQPQRGLPCSQTRLEGPQKKTGCVMITWEFNELQCYTGWWYTYPSEKWWTSSVGMIIPNIWKNTKNVPNHQPV